MGFLAEFASALRRARDCSGMTQKDLAQKIGVTTNCVSMYENARRMPSVMMASKLSTALDVPIGDIVPHVDLAPGEHDLDEAQMSIYDMIGE